MGFFSHNKQNKSATSRPPRQKKAKGTNTPKPPPYSPYEPQNPPEWTHSNIIVSELVEPPPPFHNSVPDGFDISNVIGDRFSEIISGIDNDLVPTKDDDEHTIIITESAAVTPHPSGNISQTRSISSPYILNIEKGPVEKINILSKVSYYSNTSLPPQLPLLRVYIPTWPLVCLASQYSASAYQRPQSSREKDYFVSADPRLGTKAMVMKSVPCDDKKTLVFAIRGTSILSLRDWNVNLHDQPVSPEGFLDDAGNLCHAGFLRVAKAMIKPLASRLRTLLEENPSRSSCSLLITGHSAGGAVAALLYAHMLSRTVQSELSILTDCFKRVHCVTFGTPPISLLPISKSTMDADPRHRKSLFFSFMNEGDPVVRADRAYVRSLIDLLASPLPAIQTAKHAIQKPMNRLAASVSRIDLTAQASASRLNLANPTAQVMSKASAPNLRSKISQSASRRPVWTLPPSTLFPAGRLVLLRVPAQPRSSQKNSKRSARQWEIDNVSQVSAQTVTVDQLREVVFGDPSMHAMSIYARRVEMLALKAVTARGP